MSFLKKFPPDPSPKELQSHLQRFLGRNSSTNLFSTVNKKGSTSRSKKTAPTNGGPGGDEELSIMELIHLGLWLCRNLPVTRDAVFTLLSQTYHQFVKEYIISQRSGIGQTSAAMTDDDIQILDDIHSAFSLFLDSSGEIWAPTLSTWTLQLLGNISNEYSKYVVQHNVNEIIRFWMGSKAIQSLMDLTAKCLNKDTNKEAFISALIDTSTLQSPRFDWVVAHVGNTYPQTIVTQVLDLGYQHFSTNSAMASIKLNSVRGILDHLVAGGHSKEVREGFERFIEQGLSPDPSTRMLILYIMTMCTNSQSLLDLFMDSVLPRVNETNLTHLQRIIPFWIRDHFGGREVAASTLTVHLMTKSSRGTEALQVLMDGVKSWRADIGVNARGLLDHFIAETSSIFYNASSSPPSTLEPSSTLSTTFPSGIPSMKSKVSLILPFLTDPDPQISRCAKQFIKILGLYDSTTSVGVKAILHFLTFSKEEDRHLWGLIDLVKVLQPKYPSLLKEGLIVALRESGSSLKDCFENVLKLLNSSEKRKLKLDSILRENIDVTMALIEEGSDSTVDSLIVEIISKVFEGDGNNLPFRNGLKLGRKLVYLLFRVLSDNSSVSKKVKDAANISKILYFLARENTAAQNDCLRSLIQNGLSEEGRKLFMEKIVEKRNDSNDDDEEDHFEATFLKRFSSLSKENLMRSSASLNVAGSHSTTFHSGKLIRRDYKIRVFENSEAGLNFQLFLGVLLNVCRISDDENIAEDELNGEYCGNEAMRKVALLLVEIVSPDVMFNGLPWPDEEFSKVQVERDLQIRRAFEEHPYLWELLELVANHPPSLCYCSVLLRALMATLMAFWTSCQESPSKSSPNQLEMTIRLLNIMRTGELLPPPLSYLGLVVHELRAHEVLGLLRDVWSYMKMNVPVPTIFIKKPDLKGFTRNPEFSKVEPVYTEKLRLALLSNIERVGYLYPKLFPAGSMSSGGG